MRAAGKEAGRRGYKAHVNKNGWGCSTHSLLRSFGSKTKQRIGSLGAWDYALAPLRVTSQLPAIEGEVPFLASAPRTCAVLLRLEQQNKAGLVKNERIYRGFLCGFWAPAAMQDASRGSSRTGPTLDMKP